MDLALRTVILGTRPMARRLLGVEPSGMAISFMDGSILIRDPSTPGNDFAGHFKDKLSVTGRLDVSIDGAAFSDSDRATISTSLIPFSDTAGTIIFESQDNTPTTYGPTVVFRRTSTLLQNRFDVSTGTRAGGAVDGVGRFDVIASNVNQAALGSHSFTPVATVFYKIAAAWAENDAALVASGVAGDADTSVTLPTGIDRMEIGHRNSTGLGGRIRWLVYVPRRMSNVEMIGRTS